MIRWVTTSLLALAGIFLIARSCGITPEQQEDRRLLARLNAEAGDEFRQAHAQRPEVQVWADGIQVEVLHLGEGAVPEPDDWVRVQYRGWRVDGREFANSWLRGEVATVGIDRTIPGWRTVLTAIPEGTHLTFVLPPAHAYGAEGGGLIGPEETLVFELHLLEVLPLTHPALQGMTLPELPEWEKPVPNLR
jgi:FKBP-type peptidyl-prolyl cis-trans isomerase FkpA